MSNVVETQTHTDGFIAKLRGEEITTGDGVGENDEGGDLTKPFAVVYPMPGLLGGTLEEPESDAEMVWQVTYVGKSRVQAEWLRDKGRAALLEGFNVEGRTIVRVTVDVVGEVRRDDSVEPRVFICPERYRAWSSHG